MVSIMNRDSFPQKVWTSFPDKNLNFQPQKVLIVEDDPFSNHLFRKILNEHYSNIQLIPCSSYSEAQAAYNTHGAFDLIILDIFLDEDGTGVDFYKKILGGHMRLNQKNTVIMTSALEISDYRKFFPNDMIPPPYLKKPFSAETCIDLVEIFTGGDLK